MTTIQWLVCGAAMAIVFLLGMGLGEEIKDDEVEKWKRFAIERMNRQDAAIKAFERDQYANTATMLEESGKKIMCEGTAVTGTVTRLWADDRVVCEIREEKHEKNDV